MKKLQTLKQEILGEKIANILADIGQPIFILSGIVFMGAFTMLLIMYVVTGEWVSLYRNISLIGFAVLFIGMTVGEDWLKNVVGMSFLYIWMYHLIPILI